LLSFPAALGAQTAATPPQARRPAPAVPDWKTYTYSPEGFSALFPSAPDVSKRNIETDAGTVELRSYTSADGDVALMIGVCDYGSQAAGKDPNALLQGAKNGALANANALLVSEKQIALSTYPGLQFDAESDQVRFTARIYIVGSTLYQAMVVTPLSSSYADTVHFLDSFQLVERVPAEKPAT
jgi:hypothetical protein